MRGSASTPLVSLGADCSYSRDPLLPLLLEKKIILKHVWFVFEILKEYIGFNQILSEFGWAKLDNNLFSSPEYSFVLDGNLLELGADFRARHT